MRGVVCGEGAQQYQTPQKFEEGPLEILNLTSSPVFKKVITIILLLFLVRLTVCLFGIKIMISI